MNDELLKLIYDYSVNYKIVDINYAEKLISFFILEKNINDYVQLTTIIDDEKYKGGGTCVASYFPIVRSIEIYLGSLKRCMYEERSYLNMFDEDNKAFFYNIFITQTILHELYHAQQLKKANQDSEDNESIILKACFRSCIIANKGEPYKKLINDGVREDEIDEYLQAMQRLYYFYYSYEPSERMADIYSYNDIFNALKPLNNSQILMYEKRIMKEIFLRGYKVRRQYLNSPSLYYLDRIRCDKDIKLLEFYDENKTKMFQKCINNYPFQERVNLGLCITNEEYKVLRKS